MDCSRRRTCWSTRSGRTWLSPPSGGERSARDRSMHASHESASTRALRTRVSSFQLMVARPSVRLSVTNAHSRVQTDNCRIERNNEEVSHTVLEQATKFLFMFLFLLFLSSPFRECFLEYSGAINKWLFAWSHTNPSKKGVGPFFITRE